MRAGLSQSKSYRKIENGVDVNRDLLLFRQFFAPFPPLIVEDLNFRRGY